MFSLFRFSSLSESEPVMGFYLTRTYIWLLLTFFSLAFLILLQKTSANWTNLTHGRLGGGMVDCRLKKGTDN